MIEIPARVWTALAHRTAREREAAAVARRRVAAAAAAQERRRRGLRAPAEVVLGFARELARTEAVGPRGLPLWEQRGHKVARALRVTDAGGLAWSVGSWMGGGRGTIASVDQLVDFVGPELRSLARDIGSGAIWDPICALVDRERP